MAAESKKNKTRSIANQLNGHFKRREFFRLLLIDLLVCALILVTWGLTVEAIHGGRIVNVSGRQISGLQFPSSWNVSWWFKDVHYTFTVYDQPAPSVEPVTETGLPEAIEITFNETEPAVDPGGMTEGYEPSYPETTVPEAVEIGTEDVEETMLPEENTGATDFGETEVTEHLPVGVNPDPFGFRAEGVETEVIEVPSEDPVPHGAIKWYETAQGTTVYYRPTEGEFVYTGDMATETLFFPYGEDVVIPWYVQSIYEDEAGVWCEVPVGGVKPMYIPYPVETMWYQADEILVESDEHGYTTVVADAGIILTGLTYGLFAVGAVQLFFFVISCFTGKRTIKRYLRPIDEIALSAERISAEQSVTSEKLRSIRRENHAKMQNLEESINDIDTFDERINIGDSELGGLEAAVNNMLKRLAESNRKQIQFVDDASHELRTPIAVIQGYINMLDRWGKDDPKVMEESIGALKAEAEHMQELVDQLLFLARGDMDRLVFSEERVSLAELVTEIYGESAMIDREHEYRALLPEEDCTISIDLTMFKQCVRILIDNAAKYTPAGGQILLKAYRRDKNAYIEVTDSGEGISAADMPHIFDRFYRSDTARGKQGSGLGLSIAKWIIEKHHGRIDAISREGTGTRMTVVVPVTE